MVRNTPKYAIPCKRTWRQSRHQQKRPTNTSKRDLQTLAKETYRPSMQEGMATEHAQLECL
jgi:hypothetical protein